MAKGAYIGVPSYKVIIERNMTHSSGSTWAWGTNTANEVNWTKGETYVCDVTIDGVTYPNITFSPDVGSSWFAVYPETGDAVFEVYVATNNQLYDYGLGLDTTTSHTILLSTGNFDGVARKIKKGYVGIPTLMNVPTGRTKYNNMDLPTVPEWNSTTYPYAYISYSANEGYRFLVCSAKLQYVLAQGKCTPVSNASYMYATLWNKTTGTWGSWSSVSSATANSTYFTSPTWANTAIPYSDNSNTLVSATEPTVLYEEKEVGIARKIKKAYIGIGGVARPCWSGGKLTYYGEVDPLYATGYSAGAPTGDYLVIGTEYNRTVTAYNKSFTRHAPASLSNATVTASTLNGAAIFLGGINSGSNSVTRYDASLTKTNPFTLREALGCHGARELNNCLLYAGGGPSSEYPRRDCVRVDASFTQTSLAQLTNIAYRCSSATNGKQAFFSCGYNPWNGQSYNTIDYYDESFVKGIAPDLTESGSWGTGVSHGNLAVFCLNGKNVDYYNTSVTKGKAAQTAQNRTYASAGFHLGGCALITGETIPAIIDCYDGNMVHTTPFTSLSFGGYNYNYPAGVANEEIGMFAGGGNISNVFAFVVA